MRSPFISGTSGLYIFTEWLKRESKERRKKVNSAGNIQAHDEIEYQLKNLLLIPDDFVLLMNFIEQRSL